MEHLVDGDMAANNGNWQWIASVGTDPKPYFQRLFNPMLQQQKFDPDGEYVRRWVPELADVPDSHLVEPWTMSEGDQQMAGCVIGTDYPEPIVDHAEERRVAQERYRAVLVLTLGVGVVADAQRRGAQADRGHRGRGEHDRGLRVQVAVLVADARPPPRRRCRTAGPSGARCGGPSPWP